MAVMSIRIDEKKKKMLKIIASLEDRTIGGLVEELIDNYVEENQDKLSTIIEKDDLEDVMKLAEESFLDWENDEDEVYNNL